MTTQARETRYRTNVEIFIEWDHAIERSKKCAFNARTGENPEKTFWTFIARHCEIDNRAHH